MSRYLFPSLALLVSLLLCGCGRDPGEVTVGSKMFTESVILGEIATHLGTDAGVEVNHRDQLGGTQVLWKALQLGEVDVYPEYTGTLRREIFGEEQILDDEALRGRLADFGVRMSKPLGFNNTYAMGTRKRLADRLKLKTVSNLREHPELRMGFSEEFLNRGDGWPGLRSRYNLQQDDIRGMDHDLAYRALDTGSIDVMDLYSTDAEIPYYHLAVLEDDRGYFPKYDAVFLYRADLEARAPQFVESLNRVVGQISEQDMAGMNARAKLDRIHESAAASEFLEEKLDIQATPRIDPLWRRIADYTYEHLTLVFVSLCAAVLVAIPLGILSAKQPAAGFVIIGIVGIIQTIPGLALLVALIGPLGQIGTLPTVIALFLYSLLPIVRNTFVGLKNIPGAMRESAVGLGLGTLARWRLVELPLASPTILAGIKTAAVINVGLATLGAVVGAGGYGQPILTGIRLNNYGLILEGAIPAAVLALLMQGLFELAERFLVSRGLRLRPTT